MPESANFWPPLTTVRQRFERVGEEAMSALIADIEGAGGEHARTLIPTSLVVRQSSGAAGLNPLAARCWAGGVPVERRRIPGRRAEVVASVLPSRNLLRGVRCGGAGCAESDAAARGARRVRTERWSWGWRGLV